MRKAFRYLLLFMFVLSISGCGVSENYNDGEAGARNESKSEVQDEAQGEESNRLEAPAKAIIYADEDVVVSEVETLKEPQLAEILWIPVDKETIVEESDLIFEGTIKEVREIQIQAKHLDVTYKLYKTLLTVSVDKVVSEKEGSGRKDGDIKLLVLTPPRGVIHSPRAASLPTGEG